MLRTLLSTQEMHDLLRGIIVPDQAKVAAALLEQCHDGFKTTGGLQPYERFFEKTLSYGGFDMTVPYFLAGSASVDGADIQFKRVSRFPAPFLNRNRRLVRELRRQIGEFYFGSPSVEKDPPQPGSDTDYGGDGGGYVGQATHYHYHSNRTASDNYQISDSDYESGGECVLHDEPYSSGQTSARHTQIRNDFVIIRFRRFGTKCPISFASFGYFGR
jgi:hypothetical protein